MKDAQKKNRSLSEIYESIDDSLEFIQDYPEASINTHAAGIREGVEQIKKGYRGLYLLFFALLFVLGMLIALVVVLYQQNLKVSILADEILQNAQPTGFDSLKSAILNESDGTINYREDKDGNLITYMLLLKTRDSLQSDINLYKDSLARYETKLNMAREKYGIYFKERKVGSTIYTTIGSTVFDENEKLSEEFYKQIKPLLDSINKR